MDLKEECKLRINLLAYLVCFNVSHSCFTKSVAFGKSCMQEIYSFALEVKCEFSFVVVCVMAGYTFLL